MDTNNIIKLLDAGFTADEIRTMIGVVKPVDAQPAEQAQSVDAKPEEKPEEAKPVEAKPDRTDEILGAIGKLTKAIQFSNLKNSANEKSEPPTADEIIQNALGGNIFK